jgi:ketosteroid isomerase-like protein
MSQTNLEIIKAGFEAFNSGGPEGIIQFIHPEFEATTPPELASEPDTYRGHDGVRRWFDSFYEVMDEIRWEPHSFEEAPGGRVIADFTLHARGRSTGLEFGQHAVQVWTLRDGKAIGVELHPTIEEAREAAAGP